MRGILFIAIAVVVVASLVSRHVLRREQDPFEKTRKLFRVNLVFTGGFCVLLWFLLPGTPVPSTFGYPSDVEDIRSTGSLLRSLQDYNRALVRTPDRPEVLYWFLFAFVWWFITTLFDLSRALSTKIR